MKVRTIAELRAHPHCESVWNEGEDGWWCDVAAGFRSPATGCHVFHEWSVKDLLADFNAREVCDCPECESLKSINKVQTKTTPDHE